MVLRKPRLRQAAKRWQQGNFTTLNSKKHFILTMTSSKSSLTIGFSVILLFSFTNTSVRAQTNEQKSYIKPFTASIINSNYAAAYSVVTVLNEKELKIIFRSGLVGARDTTVFAKALQLTDTLRQISEINLGQLKDYYANPCIDDGSQVTIVIKKDNKKKAVHLGNYYQEDIGKIIYLVNSLVPEKYKVWYDKETLIADYKRCKGIE
jgi:hypothetical protein